MSRTQKFKGLSAASLRLKTSNDNHYLCVKNKLLLMIATSILRNLKVQFNTYIQVLTTSYFKTLIAI